MKSLLAVALWAVFCGAAISNTYESLAAGLLGLIVIYKVHFRSRRPGR
jgi:hypothetical protein